MKIHFYTQDILNICDNNHCSVEDIFVQLQVKFPEAGKSSIYRNVENLVKQGELKKVT
jgi:Fe2+ or Zn2+ uptake regulation protein